MAFLSPYKSPYKSKSFVALNLRVLAQRARKSELFGVGGLGTLNSVPLTGPERGNRKGVTRKAAEKLPKKVNLGGPWHGNVPLSVNTRWLPLSRYPFRGQ